MLKTLGWAALPVGLLLTINGPTKAALNVASSIDAADMARALLVPGINLVDGSALYSGAPGAYGFFSGDTTIFRNPAGVQGVLFTTGSIANSLGPNDRLEASKDNFTSGNEDLNGLIGGIETVDASTLTFKITLDADGSGIEWNYVFGSEEYNTYVGSEFNDVFSLSLNGTNIALIPGSSMPISVNTINNGNSPVGDIPNESCINCLLFRNNPVNTGGINSQYNGLTTVLRASTGALRAGVVYELSFSIADATDGTNDSGVYIASASLLAPERPDGEPVPAPLPLLGACAAFGWSRKLRRRVRRLQPKVQ